MFDPIPDPPLPDLPLESPPDEAHRARLRAFRTGRRWRSLIRTIHGSYDFDQVANTWVRLPVQTRIALLECYGFDRVQPRDDLFGPPDQADWRQP